MRVDLRIAILKTGRSQRALSLDVRIPETRLSEIVRGRCQPSPAERVALVRALRRPESELFPDESRA